MDIERIIVRVLADVSGYVRHMSIAEAGLSRFEGSVARINQRTAMAAKGIEEGYVSSVTKARDRHHTAVQSAENKHTAEMMKLLRQRTTEMGQADAARRAADLAAAGRHATEMSTVRMRAWGVQNVPATSAAARAARQAFQEFDTGQISGRTLQRRMNAAGFTFDRAEYDRVRREATAARKVAVDAAEAAHRDAVAEAQRKYATGGTAADALRRNAIAAADRRRAEALATAETRRKTGLGGVAAARIEAMEEMRVRQQQIAEAHYLSAKTRLVQGTVVVGAAVGAFTLGLGAYATKLAMDFERIAISFEVMMGSAEAGARLLKDVQNLAIETPFKSQELAKYAKELMAFGVGSDNVINVLRTLGNVAAGTDGDMGRIVLAFGQVQTAGRLMGQELRQFTNAGIPVLDYLAKTMDKPVDQVRQMIHRGDVSYGDVVKAFNAMTQEGGKFAGMMDRINKETVSGRWENLTERLQVNARDFALAAFEGLNLVEVLNELSTGTQGVDKGRVGEVFRGIADAARYAVGVIHDFFQWVGRTAEAMYEWVNANRTIANLVGMLLAAVVAVRLLATALFLMRTAWAVFTFAVTVLKILTGLMGVLQVATTLLTLATYRQAAANLKAWATANAPILILIGLIGGLLALMRAFDQYGDFGAHFADGWSKTVDTMKKTWEGFTVAMQTGDSGLAFDIMWEGLLIGFKIMLNSLMAEWTRFWGEAVFFVLGIFPKIMVAFVAVITAAIGKLIEELGHLVNQIPGLEDTGNSMVVWGRDAKTNVIKGGEQAYKDLDARGDWFRQWVKEEQARAIEKVTRPNITRQDEMIRRAKTNALFEDVNARNVFNFQRDLEKLPLDTPQGVETWRNAVGAMKNPQIVQEGRLAQGFTGRMFLPAGQQAYGEQWQNVANKTGKVDELLKAGAPLNSPAVKAAAKEADAAAASLRTLTDALSKFGTVAEKIKERFEISPAAKDQVQDLMKSLDEGTSPYETFVTKTKRYQEALGPAMPLAAAGGVMAPAATGVGSPDIWGVAGPQLANRGIFREYEKMRKALNMDKETLPPVQLHGSKEAQETINRAQRESTSDTQEILKTLRLGQKMQEEQVKYEKRTTEILDQLVTEGHIIVVKDD